MCPAPPVRVIGRQSRKHRRASCAAPRMGRERSRAWATNRTVQTVSQRAHRINNTSPRHPRNRQMARPRPCAAGLRHRHRSPHCSPPRTTRDAHSCSLHHRNRRTGKSATAAPRQLHWRSCRAAAAVACRAEAVPGQRRRNDHRAWTRTHRLVDAPPVRGLERHRKTRVGA